MQLSKEAIERIFRHSIEEYPDECCGIIIGNAEKQAVHECENIQNLLHNEDPIKHPRDARTAYAIERNEAERVFSLAKETGENILAFYHSHTDHDAYFSETDKEAQTVFGEPEFPDALHIVLSVKNGKAAHLKAYQWDKTRKDFIPVEL
jgi:proteasome lid subunit RPN8/RPN11